MTPFQLDRPSPRVPARSRGLRCERGTTLRGQCDRRKPVTVCAAVLCKESDGLRDMLLGISDRMFVSGDVGYEGTQTKVFWLSHNEESPTRIVVLGADDYDSHFAV